MKSYHVGSVDGYMTHRQQEGVHARCPLYLATAGYLSIENAKADVNSQLLIRIEGSRVMSGLAWRQNGMKK